VDPQRLSGDVTHAEPLHGVGMEHRLASVAESWQEKDEVTIDREGEMWKNKGELRTGSWIDEETVSQFCIILRLGVTNVQRTNTTYDEPAPEYEPTDSR
jgi:hypothetical protein